MDVSGSFSEGNCFRVSNSIGSSSDKVKVEPVELGFERTPSPHPELLPSYDEEFPTPLPTNEVIVRINLAAVNESIDFAFDENAPLQNILHIVKPKVLAVFFEQSGYFKPYPIESIDWTIDLTFGDLSILNMVNLLTYRGEPQENLLIKDIIYGKETLEPRIFRLTSPQDSGAPGPPVEFKWNPKAKQWVAQSAPGEMLLMDARLAIHEDILYTPFTHSKGSLSLTSMKLCYLRNLNQRLRTPPSHTGFVTAVVFVGVGDYKMAVAKSYAWKEDISKGIGEILKWDEEKGVCHVRDRTGHKRMLKFRPNRSVWVEEQVCQE